MWVIAKGFSFVSNLSLFVRDYRDPIGDVQFSPVLGSRVYLMTMEVDSKLSSGLIAAHVIVIRHEMLRPCLPSLSQRSIEDLLSDECQIVLCSLRYLVHWSTTPDRFFVEANEFFIGITVNHGT